MEIQRIPVEKINPAPYNPRKDLKPSDPEYQKIRRSIQEFGFVDPLVWNKRTGHLVGGHQRLKVLIELGYKEVECSVVDLDPEREKALNIALNKIEGEWDQELLASLLEELDEDLLALTGFDNDEVEAILKTDEAGDDAPDLDDEGITVENQYGVIVLCDDESHQELVFNDLTAQGYKCRVVCV